VAEESGRRPLVRGIVWLGIKTEQMEADRRLFGELLGLRLVQEEATSLTYRLPNGDIVEVFGPDTPGQEAMPDAPVAGFLVEDIDLVRDVLEKAGIEFLGETQSAPGYGRWVSFRGPDGNVYELTWRSLARQQRATARDDGG
jgi:predicted enzyme related to lactoylglutathione lyase